MHGFALAKGCPHSLASAFFTLKAQETEHMRKTKIICTLGPKTDDAETLRAMIHAGMNVARLNFSHDTYENQKKRGDRNGIKKHSHHRR